MADYVLVPRVATEGMLSAMLCSEAVDDEGTFPALMDLLDFSGENKSRTVAKAAACAMLAARPPADYNALAVAFNEKMYARRMSDVPYLEQVAAVFKELLP